MSKKYYFGFILGLCVSFLSYSSLPAQAVELDEDIRTVPLDAKGTTTVLTNEQVKRGKRLFNSTCAVCHTGGVTKTNPNVGLDPESLSLATPARDNIQSLVSYMKSPTTYDGLE
jgi:photosystem II cytochrome c550